MIFEKTFISAGTVTIKNGFIVFPFVCLARRDGMFENTIYLFLGISFILNEFVEKFKMKKNLALNRKLFTSIIYLVIYQCRC